MCDAVLFEHTVSSAGVTEVVSFGAEAADGSFTDEDIVAPTPDESTDVGIAD